MGITHANTTQPLPFSAWTDAHDVSAGFDMGGGVITGLGAPSDPSDAARLQDVGTITSPLDIAGCALWLDASQLVLSDDDSVATWPNLGTLGGAAAQASAGLRPVYKTAIQNGLAVVRFDGADDVLALSGAGLGLVRNIPGVTVFVAGRQATLGDWPYIFADNETPGTGRMSFSGNLYVDPADGGSTAVSESMWPGEPVFNVLGAVADVALSGMVFGFSVWHANLLDAQSILATPAMFVDTASVAVLIGAGAASINGDIGELIVYQRALDAQGRRLVLEYLSDKWATL